MADRPILSRRCGFPLADAILAPDPRAEAAGWICSISSRISARNRKTTLDARALRRVRLGPALRESGYFVQLLSRQSCTTVCADLSFGECDELNERAIRVRAEQEAQNPGPDRCLVHGSKHRYIAGLKLARRSVHVIDLKCDAHEAAVLRGQGWSPPSIIAANPLD